MTCFYFIFVCDLICRSQWPRGLRRMSFSALLLKLWVRFPPGAWLFVCCECCVLSGRGLGDGLITRPEEPYRLWCVVVCDLETLKTRRLKPATGLWKYNQKDCIVRKTNKETIVTKYVSWILVLKKLQEMSEIISVFFLFILAFLNQ